MHVYLIFFIWLVHILCTLCEIYNKTQPFILKPSHEISWKFKHFYCYYDVTNRILLVWEMQCLHFKRFVIWNIGNFLYFHPQKSFILLRCYQCAVESCVYIKACGKLWRLKVVWYQVSYPFTHMIDIGVAGLFLTSRVLAWNCWSLKCKTM